MLVKGDDSTGALANARGGVEADLQGAIEVVSVGKSRRELKARAEGLAKQLGTTDALVGYRMAIATNRVELLSTNPEATRTGVRAKLGMVPEDVVVVESEPIELTVDQYGGTAANSGVTSGCPTFGFVVARTTDSNDRGLLTVNHAASTTMKYNGWSDANLNSCSGGTSISLKGRYQTASSVNLGQDFAWYKDSAAIYNAYFWQGDAWGTVRSSIYPAGGITVCKFGRVTKKTCGTTTGNEVYNGSYGWMLEVRKSAGYAKMNDVGDSGGPVWNGSSAAVGIVHAKQGTEIMLVAANYSLEENNLPIRVLIFP